MLKTLEKFGDVIKPLYVFCWPGARRKKTIHLGNDWHRSLIRSGITVRASYNQCQPSFAYSTHKKNLMDTPLELTKDDN